MCVCVCTCSCFTAHYALKPAAPLPVWCDDNTFIQEKTALPLLKTLFILGVWECVCVSVREEIDNNPFSGISLNLKLG